MASLFVVRGRDRGRHFPLSGLLHRIGRDASNDIQLMDSETSRQHAMLRCEDDRWELFDQGSSNGTRVNGDVVKSTVLASGDRIEIGSATLIFTATPKPIGAGGSGSGGSHMSNFGGLEPSAHGVEILPAGDDSASGRILSSLAPSGIAGDSVLQFSDSSDAANKLPPAPSPHAASPAPVASPPAPEAPEISDGSSINIGGPPAAAGVDRAGDSNVATHSIDPDRSLEVMYHTAIAVGRTEDLDEVLQRVLRLVFDWVEADRGCIMLRDAASGQLQAAARCDRDETPHAEHHGAPVQVPDESTGQPISISRTILDYVIEKREGVRTSNARDDARFDAAASIVRSGVREAICVPLQGRYDIVGALYVDTFQSPHTWIARGGQRRFHDDHLRLMTAIGHQAALAIEDTTYYSALLQSERLAAMGQTIAMISHHVKNILQGIRGGGYLIDAGLKREDTDAVRRGWAIVDRNQERISNLVMDMLTFSKEREPEMQHADLNATVSDAAELMRNRAHEKQVDVEVDLDVGIVEAHFDPEAIHRAVINLITNAIDAASDHARDLMDQRSEQQSELDGSSGTAPASRVSIATSRRGRRFVISVADTGPGVAPEIRAKIFSPFESGKGMRGTGLGLPVCDKIAREHGGEIEIDDRPGGGAIFRIILPPAPKKTDETQI